MGDALLETDIGQTVKDRLDNYTNAEWTRYKKEKKAKVYLFRRPANGRDKEFELRVRVWIDEVIFKFEDQNLNYYLGGELKVEGTYNFDDQKAYLRLRYKF